MNIKFIYQNINGLDLKKLATLESLLGASDQPMIVVISEHWFSKEDELRSSRFFWISTPRPDHHKKTGHENGGLALMCSISLLHELKLKKIDEFSISFQLGDLTVSSVYFPPRLNLFDISTLMQELSSLSPDILLGDINVRFGIAMADKRTWNLDRGTQICRALAKINMNIQISESGYSGVDHVFSKTALRWDYSVLPKDSFKSDHGRIEFMIESKLTTTYGNNGSIRFVYNALKDPTLKHIVQRDWFCSQPIIYEMIAKTRYKIKQDGIHERSLLQELIDYTYGVLTAVIQELCSTHLISYNAEEIKNRPEVSSANLKSPTDTIRLFKRSQRAFHQEKKFQARSACLITETAQYFKNLYGDTDEFLFQWDALSLEHFRYTSVDGYSFSQILRKYSSSKSCGPDGMHTRLLKILDEIPGCSDLFAELFNLFLDTSVTPSDWNISQIHLLMKDQNNPYIDKSRPVSLTNILRRLFEKLLLKEWIQSDWTKLNPHQAGFRRGWSTISHILLNDELCRSDSPLSVYLDLQGAFDTVNFHSLFDVLNKRCVPLKVQRLIYSLMVHDCKSLVTVNHLSLPEPISRSRGLFQGSILSPLLFNLIIDELANAITRSHPSIYILLFADDIVLKGKTFETMQSALDSCFLWSEHTRLKWNIKKCGIVSRQGSFPLLLGEDIIPNVESYKYLGLDTKASGVDWLSYIEKLITRMRNLMNRLSRKRLCWSYQQRLIIFKTFIRSTAEYCLPLLTKWIAKQKESEMLMRQLESAHNAGLAWIFGKTSLYNLLGNISGLGSFKFRASQLEASLCFHIHNLDSSNPLIQYSTTHYISSDKNFILTSCKRSSIFSEWLKYKSTEEFPLKYKTWIKHKKIEDFKQIPGILKEYILPRCRTKSLTDSFLLEPLSTASRALSWRMNRAFIRAICPNCHLTFNRGHIDRCKLLFEQSDTRLLQSDKYLKDISDICDSSGKSKVEYTLLDFYLNNQDYKKFDELFSHLRRMIYKGPDSH